MTRTGLLFIALSVGAALGSGLLACDKAGSEATVAPQPAPSASDEKPATPPVPTAAPAVTGKVEGKAKKPGKGEASGETSIRLRELPNAGKAPASDGESLTKARALVDAMALELKRSTAAVVMAGKDKSKVDVIGADFQKLNKTMSSQMEAISERLTPAELAQFEDHTRVTLSPLINQLLQAFFSSGGMQPAGAGPNGSTRLVPLGPGAAAPASTATPAPAAIPATPKATPVAAAAAPPAAVAPTAAPAAPAADAVQLVVAKAGVDAMVKELGGIISRIRAANNDKGKLRRINKDYTAINQKHAASIPKLVAVLNGPQKAAFGDYLKAKLMPVSSQLVEAFTSAGATPNP